MKKLKTIKEFFFKTPNVVDEINANLPINIKYLESLIDRIYKRYPLIDKSKISVIVKTVFESMRELLVQGHIFNFNRFAFDIKLLFYKQGPYPVLKVKLTTPPAIKRKK